MRLIGRKILTDFCQSHADVRNQISAWVGFVEHSEWKTPEDIKARFASVSFLPNNRVIFNLKGNSYRLEAKINYKLKIVKVVRIGTHAEYDKWK